MKHREKALVVAEKPGLFGKEKVLEKRTIVMDGKSPPEADGQLANSLLTIDEILFYNDGELDW